VAVVCAQLSFSVASVFGLVRALVFLCFLPGLFLD
jgi:hypothetical protein